jgi:hypothetical protein
MIAASDLENHVPGKNAAVEDWLRVHRQLMDQERDFAELALKAAAGEITENELQTARVQLMALRELCSVVYGKAFPRGG